MEINNQHIISIIPARGGSKRIPNKNILSIAGKPLIAYTIEHALNSKYINETYVSTDDEEIKKISRKYGVNVVERPLELRGDFATSESALIHVLDHRKNKGLNDPDYVVFLQCTSPIRKDDDIDNAINKIIDSDADSLLSVCDNKRFLWEYKNKTAISINYNYENRQREQDMEPQYQENGSIYIMKPELLRETNNRLGEIIDLYEMNYWSSFQIDEEEDVKLISWLLSNKQDIHAVKSPENIELIVFDFDGVMTDNSCLVNEDGVESVKVNRSDGLGVSLLKDAGYKMIVLSKEKNKVVEKRCEKLELNFFQGIDNKLDFLKSFLSKNDIKSKNVIYVGNDINDLESMKYVGHPFAVSDSHPGIINSSRYISSLPGGKGAVRELADWLLSPEQPTDICINKNFNL